MKKIDYDETILKVNCPKIIMKRYSLLQHPSRPLVWIDIAKEKPPPFGGVLIWDGHDVIRCSMCEGRIVKKCCWGKDDEFMHICYMTTATHWMFLPDGPEEKGAI